MPKCQAYAVGSLAVARQSGPCAAARQITGKGKKIAVTVTHSKLPNRLVSAASGIDYAYRDAGDGAVPLVVLQHFGGNLDSWDPALIDALAPTRRVVTFDNTGVGGSSGTTPNLIQQMAPLIDPGYLTDPSDVTRVIEGLRAARTIAAARALAPFRDKELFPGAGRRHRRRLPRLPAQHHHHFRACSPASRPLRHDRTQAARSQKGPGTCRHGHPGCSETQVRSVR
jgi:hypothetical protein